MVKAEVRDLAWLVVFNLSVPHCSQQQEGAKAGSIFTDHVQITIARLAFRLQHCPRHILHRTWSQGLLVQDGLSSFQVH